MLIFLNGGRFTKTVRNIEPFKENYGLSIFSPEQNITTTVLLYSSD